MLWTVILVEMRRVVSATCNKAAAECRLSVLLDIITLAVLSVAHGGAKVPVDEILPQGKPSAFTERSVPAGILIYRVAADNDLCVAGVCYGTTSGSVSAVYMVMDTMYNDTAGIDTYTATSDIDITIRGCSLRNGDAAASDIEM